MTSEQATYGSTADASQTLASPSPVPAQGRLSLRCNFSWMFVAKMVYAGCQWGMLSVIAKLGTPVVVGQFVLAVAVSTPVMTLFCLQLRLVQATDSRREYRFGDYFSLRLITTLLGLITIVVIGFIAGYSPEVSLILMAVGISAAVDCVSDIVHGLMQQRERMDRMAQSMMMRGVLSLVGLSLALWITGEVLYGVLAIAASRLLVLFTWDLPSAAGVLRSAGSETSGDDRDTSLVPTWDVGKLIRLAGLAWPLGLVMMLIVLAGTIPRYFVEGYLGEHALGIFGAIGYLGLAGIMAVGALGESATARLAEYYASRRTSAFCTLLLKLCAFAVAIGCAGVVVAVVAGGPILTVLYGPEYAAHADILVWVMIAAGISYVVWFVNHSVTAVRYFRSQLPLHLLAAAIAGVACWWLVPHYGLTGAAVALSVTGVAQLVGAGLVISHALWKQATTASP